jgi:hypothetical protein
MSGHYEVQEGEYVETSENLKDIIEEQLEKEQLSKPGGEEERLRREEEDRKQREEELLTLMCDLDGGLSLMLDRVKQTIASSKDASLFLKKRAQMEDEYARNLIKLSASFIDVPGDEGKQGSYKENWIRVLKVNEQVGQARLRFAASLLEASDGLANLAKETERNRKNVTPLECGDVGSSKSPMSDWRSSSKRTNKHSTRASKSTSSPVKTGNAS